MSTGSNHGGSSDHDQEPENVINPLLSDKVYVDQLITLKHVYLCVAHALNIKYPMYIPPEGGSPLEPRTGLPLYSVYNKDAKKTSGSIAQMINIPSPPFHIDNYRITPTLFEGTRCRMNSILQQYSYRYIGLVYDKRFLSGNKDFDSLSSHDLVNTIFPENDKDKNIKEYSDMMEKAYIKIQKDMKRVYQSKGIEKSSPHNSSETLKVMKAMSQRMKLIDDTIMNGDENNKYTNIKYPTNLLRNPCDNKYPRDFGHYINFNHCHYLFKSLWNGELNYRRVFKYEESYINSSGFEDKYIVEEEVF